MARSELLAAGAVLAVWELHRAYATSAPSLTELRRSHRDDVDHRQRLLDADLMIGGLALIAGVAASVLTRAWLPAVVTVGAYAWLVGWHHLVLSSLTPDEIP